MLGHGDDLGGDHGAHAIVGGGEGLHLPSGAHEHEVQVGIGLERLGRAGEHHRGPEIAPHDVHGDGYRFSHEYTPC